MHDTNNKSEVEIKEIINVYEMLRKILKVASAHKTDPYTKFSKIIKLCNSCPIVHIDSLINESSIIDICNRIRNYLKISLVDVKNSKNLLKNINNLLILADSLKCKTHESFKINDKGIIIENIFKHKAIYTISLILPMPALLQQKAHPIVSGSTFLKLYYEGNRILNVLNDFHALNISFNPMFDYYKGAEREIYTDINVDINLPLISKNSLYTQDKLIDIKKVFAFENEEDSINLNSDKKINPTSIIFIDSSNSMQTTIQAPTRMKKIDINFVKRKIARNNYTTNKYSTIKYIYWNYPESKRIGVIEDKIKDTLFKDKYYDYFTFYDDIDTLMVSIPMYPIPVTVVNKSAKWKNPSIANFISNVSFPTLF